MRCFRSLLLVLTIVVFLLSSAMAGDLSQYPVLSSERAENGAEVSSFRYGTSVLGRDLVCWRIQPESYTNTILLNFAIHGWEDQYGWDGEMLVDYANMMLAHFMGSKELYQNRIFIIPCANPDGLAAGYTNHGFGRCNAEGIDLNRDFDANHEIVPEPRNYTPAPFSAVESRAMRDLVLALQPDMVLDFHGWLKYTMGSPRLGELFESIVKLDYKSELTDSARGYFSYWAQLQGAEALLVEIKPITYNLRNELLQVMDEILKLNAGN